MKQNRFVYGPVPSRRLGLSIGISPLPGKSCNYSCVYCQLGRTYKYTKSRQDFYDYQDIVSEFRESINRSEAEFDVVTIVGEGEPTLYRDLKDLVTSVRQYTSKPVCIITNGSLLWESSVQEALASADIVMPTFDFIDNRSLIRIHRPAKDLNFEKIYDGLIDFSRGYNGEIWLEYMLIKDVNDSDDYIEKYRKLIENVKYSRLYVNIPIRPPAESWVTVPEKKRIEAAVDMLDATSIEMLVSEGFKSFSKDPLQAVCEIIRRHPMNQHEITGFLASRGISGTDEFFCALNAVPGVHRVDYMGFSTYRLSD